MATLFVKLTIHSSFFVFTPVRLSLFSFSLLLLPHFFLIHFSGGIVSLCMRAYILIFDLALT